MLELVCRHHHLNSLVKFKGVVTRRTGVFPQLQMVKYNCVRCQMILGPFFQNNENEIKVGACPSCQSTGPFDVSSRLSTSTCCFHSCFAKAKIPHVCNACLNGHGINIVYQLHIQQYLHRAVAIVMLWSAKLEPAKMQAYFTSSCLLIYAKLKPAQRCLRGPPQTHPSLWIFFAAQCCRDSVSQLSEGYCAREPWDSACWASTKAQGSGSVA